MVLNILKTAPCGHNGSANAQEAGAETELGQWVTGYVVKDAVNKVRMSCLTEAMCVPLPRPARAASHENQKAGYNLTPSVWCG